MQENNLSGYVTNECLLTILEPVLRIMDFLIPPHAKLFELFGAWTRPSWRLSLGLFWKLSPNLSPEPDPEPVPETVPDCPRAPNS
jgi:hypothetical protein